VFGKARLQRRHEPHKHWACSLSLGNFSKVDPKCRF
jgi:hypothetical protein